MCPPRSPIRTLAPLVWGAGKGCLARQANKQEPRMARRRGGGNPRRGRRKQQEEEKVEKVAGKTVRWRGSGIEKARLP